MATGARVIAIEEHFWIPELRPPGMIGRGDSTPIRAGLDDLGAARIAAMDAAGIDVQVISHAPSPLQDLPPDDAVRLALLANDVLHAAIARHPDRFAGFAILPTPDPEAASRELRRAVRELGLRGAMIHGRTHGEFLDLPRYRCIFAEAVELGVPVYIHPGTPDPTVVAAYYAPYRAMEGAGMGFTVETAVHAMRLVMSGLFDDFPTLQIILGHLGEALPFLLWRSDMALSRATTLKRRFGDYVRQNIHVTTSGNFSHPALQCCLAELGAARVMFAVDYPYAANNEATAFIRAAAIPEEARAAILSGNARNLLGLN